MHDSGSCDLGSNPSTPTIFMKISVRAIIFDWGRTLFESESKVEFPESNSILEFCQKRLYRLALVSLVSSIANATLQERIKQIETSPLRHFFEFTAITDKDKDKALDEVVAKLGLPRNEILIVDDRTIRGIKYGNKRGHPTVWLQKGKFANELPNKDTGIPTSTIQSLNQLSDIII